MNDVKKLYELWLEGTAEDEAVHAELEAIRDNEEEILDRFYRCLEFGTAGLRGVLGAGTNRMNKYTVGQATQGLADYLNGKYDSPAVAIGYDSRINSDVFARLSAEILAANGIKVYIYPRLMPTPMVSYAVMRLECKGGIVITASHNPSKYNGYKCYDPKGYQMTEEAADETYSYIKKTDIFRGVKKADFDECMKSGLIEYISDEIIEEFYALCLKKPVHPELDKSKVKIIYTPLNGTGNIPVRTVLSKAGYNDINVVKEQEMPDGTFPTCPYPNPEIRQVFDCGLEMAKEEKPDLLFATDPDCDRIGAAVPVDDDYRLITGNEMGALLTNYLLSEKKAAGTLSEHPVVIKSFVSTKLVDKICAKYGAQLIETLTGFKYMGECLTKLVGEGRENDFIMAFEESYGYLLGTHARDKDAVAASLLICEMAAFYKSKGMTLADVLAGLYEEFGASCDKQKSFMFEGADGMVKMKEIMEKTANNPPESVGGFKVLKHYNYNTSLIVDVEAGETDKIQLPPSNILAYALEGGHFAIMRPSGTEPKIKFYITGCGGDMQTAADNAEKINKGMEALLV